jgi:hypothetical protein
VNAGPVAAELHYGLPARAVELGRRVLARSPDAGPAGEVALVLGEAYTALGRFGTAMRILEPLAGPAADPAAVLLGSVHRQLGDHRTAERYDTVALSGAERTGDRRLAAAARLGLCADAVGCGDLVAARARMAAFRESGDGADTSDPLQAVAAGWVATEIALLAGEPGVAVVAATAAADRAASALAPWHRAKSDLFLGVAQVTAGRPVSGVATLEIAAAAAERLGADALGWVASTLLATHVGGRPGRRWAVTGLTLASRIADDLPMPIRHTFVSSANVTVPSSGD